MNIRFLIVRFKLKSLLRKGWMSERLKESVLKTEVSRIPGVRIPLHPWVCQRINQLHSLQCVSPEPMAPFLEHSTYKERVEEPPLPLVFVGGNRQAISPRLRPLGGPKGRVQRRPLYERKKGAKTSKYLPAGTRCGNKRKVWDLDSFV